MQEAVAQPATPAKAPALFGNIPLWSLVTAAAVLLYLLRNLLSTETNISSWVSMRVCAVNLMMTGFRPYVDFWDWTLPTVYDCLKVPFDFRVLLEHCHMYLPITVFINDLIWMITCLSVLVTTLIVKRGLAALELDPEKKSTLDELKLIAVPFVTSIALGSLIVRFDLGDLQHLLALAIFPWLLVRWLSYHGCYVGNWLSLIVGAIAGVAACFDVPFVLVFVALELYFVLRSRSLKVLMRPEVLGFALAGFVCLVRMSQLGEPEGSAFWKWTMGLRMLNYEVYDESLFAAPFSPDRRDVCYTLALAVALAFVLQKKSTMLAPLMLVAICGFGLFVLEGQGLSHDLILCIMASTAILSIVFIALVGEAGSKFLSLKDRDFLAGLKNPLTLVVAMIVTFAFGYSLDRDCERLKNVRCELAINGVVDTMSAIDKYSKWKDRVLVLSDQPGGAYPTLLILDRAPGGYLLWSRPLRLFEYLKTKRTLEGPMKDFYRFVYTKLAMDLKSPSLKLVLMHDVHEHEILNKEKVVEILQQQYLSLPPCRTVSDGNWQPREYAGPPYDYCLYQRPEKNASK